jgi:hypothetical protein
MRSIHLGAAIFLASLLTLTILSLHIPNRDRQDQVSATVVVTRDYGSIVLKEGEVRLEAGGSALDLLRKIADVETAYGGEFVLSIDGVRSGYPDVKSDWFYYVNGFLAKEGAASYMVSEGDNIQWDYHSWDTEIRESAILGGYPEYFVKGYGGRKAETIILFEDELLMEAERLQHHLHSTYSVSATMLAMGMDGEDRKSGTNVILLARPEDRLVCELNENRRHVGFHAWFSDAELVQADCSGEVRRRHGEAGVIQVTQNIWNSKGTLACENVVLLISGTSLRSIKMAVDTLIENPQSYRYAFGLIVSEEGVSRIPVCGTE